MNDAGKDTINVVGVEDPVTRDKTKAFEKELEHITDERGPHTPSDATDVDQD